MEPCSKRNADNLHGLVFGNSAGVDITRDLEARTEVRGVDSREDDHWLQFDLVLLVNATINPSPRV